MPMRDYAVINEAGELEEIVPHLEEMVPPLNQQVGNKAYPVVRVSNPPTQFHARTGETAAVVSGQYVITATWAAPSDLDAVKASLRQQIDNYAETIRLQFITPGAGQSMVYQRKAQEARDYLAQETPNPANYPILMASVGIEGETLAQVAGMVVAKESLWAGISAFIEGKRLAGKASVSDAADAVAACAAHDAIDWTLPQ
jgi:hypothetical protein